MIMSDNDKPVAMTADNRKGRHSRAVVLRSLTSGGRSGIAIQRVLEVHSNLTVVVVVVCC